MKSMRLFSEGRRRQSITVESAVFQKQRPSAKQAAGETTLMPAPFLPEYLVGKTMAGADADKDDRSPIHTKGDNLSRMRDFNNVEFRCNADPAHA
jgi:hypothetical protein